MRFGARPAQPLNASTRLAIPAAEGVPRNPTRNPLGLRASSERHGAEPYCRTWNVWDNGGTRCYTVYRDGEAFELHLEDRLSKFVLTRRTGNPEHY